MEDHRKTIRSGLPAELSSELDALVGALVPANDPASTSPPARYRLERVLGRGALFVTFRATRISPEGAVPHAVKVLRPSLARAWPAGAKVLSREQARVLAILNERLPPSPNVVRLFEIGELAIDPARGIDVPVPWLALELIESDLRDDGTAVGASLFDQVRASIASIGVGLDPAAVLAIVRGVASGLDWIHQHGLLHRGVTPHNVLVSGRGARTIAKISDVAIARPAGLPSTFGLAPGAGALAGEGASVLSAEPYRAPEQRDPHAELSPATDVFALGALVRFVMTGRGPRDGDVPLAQHDALHPGFARTSLGREHLEALEDALIILRTEEAEYRPPTAFSAWELLGPPLEALANTFSGALAADLRAARRSSPPPRVRTREGSWVWTERHRPSKPLPVSALAVDPEGHALAAMGGARLAYFDGRSFRPPMPSDLVIVEGLATLGPASFLAFGRGSRGARALRLDAEGWTPVRDGRGDTFVAACAIAEPPKAGRVWGSDGEIAYVERQGGALVATDRFETVLEGAASVRAITTLDPDTLLVVGDAKAGGPWLATIDRRSGTLRPQAPPSPGRLFAAATAEVMQSAWLAGAHGSAFFAHRPFDAMARVRTTREPVPTHDDLSAIAVAADGGTWCAAGSAIFRREGEDGWQCVFREDSIQRILALAPRARGLLAFTDDGAVFEGRALSM